jgi:hypothetical protein
MNHTPDAVTAGSDDSFDPRQAAALLEQTTQQTRRRLAPYPPWLLVIRAVLVLAVLGTAWLTVRGQHPYKGPTAAVFPVVLAFAVVNLVATLAVARRATAGVAGKSRLRPWEITIMVVAWFSVFAVMAGLASAGVSHAIVYGVYPNTVPLIVAGLSWGGIMAARANWRPCFSALAIAVVGAIGTVAGPAGAWAVAGVGICVVLLGSAAAIAWQQRRGVVRP